MKDHWREDEDFFMSLTQCFFTPRYLSQPAMYGSLRKKKEFLGTPNAFVKVQETSLKKTKTRFFLEVFISKGGCAIIKPLLSSIGLTARWFLSHFFGEPCLRQREINSNFQLLRQGSVTRASEFLEKILELETDMNQVCNK